MKTITQRELRNRMSRVLRRVEAGERLRITLDDRPVADLVPVRALHRSFVPKGQFLQLLKRAPLDSLRRAITVQDFAKDWDHWSKA